MSEKMTKKQAVSISVVWIIVAIVIALAFLLFGGDAGISSGSKDTFNVNVLPANWSAVEPNYVNDSIPSDITKEEILAMTGSSPFLSYIPAGYELAGTAYYIPIDQEGNEKPDDSVFGVLYTNPESEAYSIIIKVARGPVMNINHPTAVFNVGLGDDTQAWSSIEGTRLKVFKQDLTGIYSTIFLKDGHLWRIDTTNLAEEELIKIIRSIV
ncbi:MAG: hypothetical protein IJC25_00440 [Clostridia bacterium]|nr:hypothetical protein [Clostridia bacterium]